MFDEKTYKNCATKETCMSMYLASYLCGLAGRKMTITMNPNNCNEKCVGYEPIEKE